MNCFVTTLDRDLTGTSPVLSLRLTLDEDIKRCAAQVEQEPLGSDLMTKMRG